MKNALADANPRPLHCEVMAVTMRDFDNHVTHPRPRLPITRLQVAMIIVPVYAGLAVGAWFLFHFLDMIRGYDDARDDQMATLFAVVFGVMCIWLLVRLFKQPRPADFRKLLQNYRSP